ncbi:MAG TPA: APC family permease [Actinocrinis sp.]|nr:APC family permease [Actinocrinis sp.]
MTVNDDPAVPEPAMRRSLGTWGSAAIAASSIAATTSIGVGMGALASAAGAQAPAIVLIAFLPILGIATAFARLNRVEPNCGNGYVWVRQSLGPWLGFVTGWINLAGAVIYGSYATVLTGSVVLQTVTQAGWDSIGSLTLDPNSTAQSTIAGFLVLSATVWVAVTGIRRVARLQIAFLVFEYTVLIVFCGWAILRGKQPFSWSWLNPFATSGPMALAQGLVVAVYFYWGWDSAFGATEESRSQRHTERGGYLALFATLGLFVYCIIALQRVMPLPELILGGQQALTTLGDKLASDPIALLPPLALLVSAISSIQSGLVPTVRSTLAMGRDGTLGKSWAKVHPRRGTPLIGTVAIACVGGAIALASLAMPSLNKAVIAVANSIGLIVSIYYGLTALACAVRFKNERGRAVLTAAVVPAVSGLCLLGAGGLLIYNYATTSSSFAVDPDNGWFLLVMPTLIIGSGLVMAAVAKWGRKSPYFQRDHVPVSSAPTLQTATAEP